METRNAHRTPAHRIVRPLRTLGDLKAQLETLTPEQLGQSIQWAGEERGGTIDSMMVLLVDHVNPTGESIEPISAYDEGEVDGEDIIPAGTIFLLEDDDESSHAPPIHEDILGNHDVG